MSFEKVVARLLQPVACDSTHSPLLETQSMFGTANPHPASMVSSTPAISRQ